MSKSETRNPKLEISVVAGRNPVREALEAERPMEKLLLQRDLKGGDIGQLRSLAKKHGVPMQYVPATKLDKLADGANHQGVVALIAPVDYRDLDEVLAEAVPTRDDVKARKPILVLLDEITDPYNFGAIIRSAAAAGATAVVVPERGSAPLSAVTVKASAGAALRLPVARVTNLADTIAALKERGFWVAGTAVDGDETVWSADWDRPLALVIGSEGDGMRPRVRAACDFTVSIPMRDATESLNASVAAGIVLFAAVRDRI